MDFIIVFFRDYIDGWIYYTILVVNVIFILAIIGYISEKEKEQMMKLNINTAPPINDGKTVNLNSVTSVKPQAVGLTQMAATQANNNQPVNPQPVVQNPIPVANNAPVNGNTQAKPLEESKQNSPQEEVPAVLVINGNDFNQGAK